MVGHDRCPKHFLDWLRGTATTCHSLGIARISLGTKRPQHTFRGAYTSQALARCVAPGRLPARMERGRPCQPAGPGAGRNPETCSEHPRRMLAEGLWSHFQALDGKFDKRWQLLTRFGPNRASFGRVWPNLARTRPDVGTSGLNWTNSGQMLTKERNLSRHLVYSSCQDRPFCPCRGLNDSGRRFVVAGSAACRSMLNSLRHECSGLGSS